MVQAGSRRKRFAVIAIATALVAGGGGAAFAYWTATGQGQGTATTGSNFSVTSTETNLVGLSPDGVPQSVGFTVSNLAPASKMLDSVLVTVAWPDGRAWIDPETGCSSADYLVGAVDFPRRVIAAHDSVTGTVEVSMVDTLKNQDGCQGIAVPLHIVAS